LLPCFIPLPRFWTWRRRWSEEKRSRLKAWRPPTQPQSGSQNCRSGAEARAG
jgi:hypothetical protein